MKIKIGKLYIGYCGCGDELFGYKRRVNLLIKENYKPIGKITVSFGRYWDKYIQAMIKEIKL